MHQYTAQEYFDLLVKTSKEGGFPSIQVTRIGGTNCRYRLPNSQKRCAIGLVIPDGVYCPDMEGQALEDLINTGLDLEEIGLSKFSEEDLDEIQGLHDTMATTVCSLASKWDHKMFVRNLKFIGCFRECEVNYGMGI